jgi:hypothetical protein
MGLKMIKLKVHQYNQGKEKDRCFKFIGHEDYYHILNEG